MIHCHLHIAPNYDLMFQKCTKFYSLTVKNKKVQDLDVNDHKIWQQLNKPSAKNNMIILNPKAAPKNGPMSWPIFCAYLTSFSIEKKF